MGKLNDGTEDTGHVPTSLNTIGPNAPVSIHIVSSQLASATSTCAFYPFDTLKTRFMSQDGTTVRQHNGHVYSSIRGSLALIYREEGLLPLFRGCPVAIIGSTIAWGIYMFLYRQLCNMSECTSYLGRSSISLLSSAEADPTRSGVLSSWIMMSQNLLPRFVFSTIASCTSAVACNPIWLIKTRMQLEEASTRRVFAQRHFRTFRGGLLHTVQTTGVYSLWRGVSAQIVLGIPNAMNLPLYDTIKAAMLNTRRTSELSVPEVCACSTLTKVVLTLVCHPVMVLKTRLQDHRAREGEIHYKSFIQSTKTIWQRGGLLAFYRGTLPSLCHTVPRSLLMFLFYEQSLKVSRCLWS
ncbi:hypothetical protein JKF63_02473 [Porcisia hertigi]|uniref:Mitochondrial carrier protein n=1 Tax=Porcisia hertigi TaxID=2761500 RepID=A0A836I111_9TRYP|nr:hypothetical protein JKF63_02473 [Porcisia hertigi]